MPDVLIRNIPAEDLARIDEKAERLGLSRADYLRRQLRVEARRGTVEVDIADLDRLSATISDLADPQVMADAWS